MFIKLFKIILVDSLGSWWDFELDLLDLGLNFEFELDLLDLGLNFEFELEFALVLDFGFDLEFGSGSGLEIALALGSLQD